MRTVIQRVQFATVKVGGEVVADIKEGLLVLVGFEDADSIEDSRWLVNKICNLRIFDDGQGVMNRSVLETGGEILVVSQFTLHASTKKGNRPSYIRAAKPGVAIYLYKLFCDEISAVLQKKVQQGIFGADMKVSLLNDGPVTIVIDTKNKE
ncbi:MAG: D-tyrosyl-tRNA(Tyr) deacylase [Tannerella sp.]|jgi:D-tyrosyl-tRNA(Tyr) deacylase|nr:D-tyrosyl-tRNA(Tyr) deacylase [Tannerella sp.]